METNPLSATVSATRALFGNPGGAVQSWITEPAVFLPLSVRRYRRLGN